MSAKFARRLAYGIALLVLGALLRPWIELAFWPNPFRPGSMTGEYCCLNPPGRVVYRLVHDGTVVRVAQGPMTFYPSEDHGLWQMVEPNICVVTMRLVQSVEGASYNSFYFRTDLGRLDAEQFASIQEARVAQRGNLKQ